MRPADHNPIHVDLDFAEEAGFDDVLPTGDGDGLSGPSIDGCRYAGADPAPSLRGLPRLRNSATQLTCEGELPNCSKQWAKNESAFLTAKNEKRRDQLAGEAVIAV